MKRRGLWKWLSIAFSLFVATAAIGVSFINVGYAAKNGAINDWAEEGLRISYNGDAEDTWTSDYSKNQIIGSVKSSSGCGTTHYETTLTFTCDLAGTLSFDYLVEVNGTIKVDGTDVTKGGHFVKELSKNGSATVYLKSSSTSAANKITITNIALQIPAAPASIRFELNSVCSYLAFINDAPATIGTDIDCLLGDKIVVKSPTPANGYKFVGWKKNGVLSGSDTTLNFTVLEPVTTVEICAADEKAASFEVNQEIFYDLQDAIDYAENTSPKIVKLSSSGQVEPKKDGSEYVFDGVNLFITGTSTSNYDDFAKKIPPTTKDIASYTCQYHLTLLPKTVLEFNSGSSLCVAGKLFAGPGGQLAGKPVGDIGELVLSEGSKIELKSGSNLYAWGYVSGEGDIHARSGSTVYEGYAFYYRGGTGTTGIIGKKVFAFNQYFIQNIECNLHINYGACEKTSTAVYSLRRIYSTTFTFMGSDGMFVLKEGCEVVKYYNPLADRLYMNVKGNGSLSHIIVEIGPVTVDSADYTLPIMNNMDIVVTDGMVTVEQNLDFLPESTIEVSEGATLIVAPSKTLFFYDLSNWVGKGFSYVKDGAKLAYVSPHASPDFDKNPRILANGAEMVADGEVQCSGGVYMTKNSLDSQKWKAMAKITSNGHGTFKYLNSDYDSTAATNVKTKQGAQDKDNKISVTEMETTPAAFMHADNTFYSGTCSTNESLVYENGIWKVQRQGPREITITFKDADETTIIGTKKYMIDGSGIELPNQTEFAGFQGSIFLWLVETDKSRFYEPNITINTITENITLVAFTGGWYMTDKDTFYFDRTLGKIKGLRYIDAEEGQPENLYCFDENGHLLTGTGEFFTYSQGTKYNGGGDGNVYYVNNGVVQNNKGFAKLDVPTVDDLASYYYYFGPSHYAYRNTTCYINTNLNDLLPEGVYTFGNDGQVEVLECSNFEGVNSVTLSADGYCTFGTIKAGIGLFVSGSHIYYAKDDGSIMKDGTYYVEEGKRNGKVTEAGLYYFDKDGYLCDSLMKPIEVKPSEANA